MYRIIKLHLAIVSQNRFQLRQIPQIIVGIVTDPRNRSMYSMWAALRLEVGSRVGASSRVVVLLEVRLEGRRTSAVLGLVAQG